MNAFLKAIGRSTSIWETLDEGEGSWPLLEEEQGSWVVRTLDCFFHLY